MRLHLQDLVNRLSQFSEKLDNTTLLIDKPWVLIDAESNYHKYIFKRNGELIMSRNGQSHIGRWEYVTAGRSLLIHRKEDDIVLLNQSFFDSAVMALKIDGTTNELFILANETIIPDLDVAKYLQSMADTRFDILTRRLENGRTIEIYDSLHKIAFYQETLDIGKEVTIDGEKADDGTYNEQRDNNKDGIYYEVRYGKISKVTFPVNHRTVNDQYLMIHQTFKHFISIGDLVVIDNQPAKTGKYKLSAFKHLVVVNGIVTDVTWF
jgi:hypothetical protein